MKTFAILILFVAITQACIINIVPNKTSGSVGETIKATISLKKQHLNCPLPLDSTGLVVTGATIISQTDWQKKSIVEYEKSIELKLSGPNQTVIQVSRTCNIKPSQVTIPIKVNNQAVINKTTQVKNDTFIKTITNIKGVTSQLLANLEKLSVYRNTLSSLAQIETNPANLSKIKQVITQLDSIIKYSQPFSSQCSLLLKKY